MTIRKITIFGAGSIGSLIGGKLSLAGNDVTLIGRELHVNAVNRDGLQIVDPKGKKVKIKIRAETTLGKEPLDLVFVTTKAFDNEVAAQHIYQRTGKETQVILLQNGVGNEKPFLNLFLKKQILRGVTTEAANLVKPGLVLHNASGYTRIGSLSNLTRGTSEEIANLLSESGIATQPTTSIEEEVWKKCLLNSTLNPLGAIAGSKNGAVFRNKSLTFLADELIQEIIPICENKGVQISTEEAKSLVRHVASKTSDNECSMLQDLRKRRRTEIDYLNGAIFNEAQAMGLIAPYNHTIYLLIKGLERTFSKKKDGNLP